MKKTTRKCTSYCKQILPLTSEYFYKNKSNSYGFDHKCKKCTKRKREENKEYFKEKTKEWHDNHKDELIQYYTERYSNNKKYYYEYKEKNLTKIKRKRKLDNIKNKERNKQYIINKYKNDPQFRIRSLIAHRIYNKLKKFNIEKSKHTIELINCTLDELKQHIEKQFKPEMNWSNLGKIWEIDHIKQCALFDLTKLEEQQKCFHYTNLRPLFKTTQIAKSFGYDYIIGNRNRKKFE